MPTRSGSSLLSFSRRISNLNPSERRILFHSTLLDSTFGVNVRPITQGEDRAVRGAREAWSFCSIRFTWSLREKVIVPKNKTNLIFEGKGHLNTFLSWNDTVGSSGGTFYSFSVNILVSKFIAYNLSFQNTAPPPAPGVEDAQAVALQVYGDKAAFNVCVMYGAQDTLLDRSARHYLLHSRLHRFHLWKWKITISGGLD